MDRQLTFAELEHDAKKRKTRRELFLEKMDGLIPWSRLQGRIAPFYPKAGRGRRPYPLDSMPRVHCVRLFYNLSDPGMEELLYEAESVRRFAGLRLSGPLPDETTIPSFRRLLEEHGLGEALFEEIDAHLVAQGHGLKTGTIVDAESGLTHSLETTPANESDVAVAHTVLHGGEKRVWGDAGHAGVGKREENREREVDWRIAMRRGQRKLLDKDGPEEKAERRKGSVRAKVEHPFLYVKRHFGYSKVRYRGLAKNTQRIALLPGFSNLPIAGRYAAA